MNMSECSSTVFRSRRSCDSNSSALAPEISDTYPGTKGKTQGDRNEIKPAKNAAIGKGSDDIVSYCNVWKYAFPVPFVIFPRRSAGCGLRQYCRRRDAIPAIARTADQAFTSAG